jgi:hypothetical protein
LPVEASAAELVGGAVARYLPRRAAVGGETVERFAVEGDLALAIGAHDRAELDIRLDDAVGALTPFESVSGTQMAVQLPMQRTVPLFS